MLGVWSKSFADYKTKYFGNVMRVPIVRTSVIDTNFVSILLLVSVLFSRTPYLLLIGGWYRWAGEIKMASLNSNLPLPQCLHIT